MVEPAMRFELMTSSLPRRRSTPELRGREPTSFASFSGAGDEIRTRDPQLGRLMLYQLSYTRSLNCGLRNSNCGMPVSQRVLQIQNPQSEIRNPKSSLVQGVGFEPT